MKIFSKPCGDYQTNCYVISKNWREIIIDPGQDSYDFVVKNSHAPLTILNTHGHSDHVLDNVSLKNFLMFRSTSTKTIISCFMTIFGMRVSSRCMTPSA